MPHPDTAIHRSAAVGYGAAASTYAGGRPGYPPAVSNWLRDDLGLRAGTSVLDLGSGTGKFLPSLRASGARVTAVEPVAAMRKALMLNHADVATFEGTAEAIPLPAGTMDAVVCAQSFHWFATPAALAEIRRVLRPGATLGLVWNVRDETVPWVAALSRITDPYEAGTPRYRSDLWRTLFPAGGRFAPIAEHAVPHAHVGHVDDVVIRRTLSVSFIAALPARERGAVERAVRGLVAATPELASGGDVSFPYVTRMFAYRCDAAD